MLFKPYDPALGPSVYRRNLPHWQQPGATYFVTFRLADSLPAQALKELENDRSDWLAERGITSPEQLAEHPIEVRQEFARTFNARWHQLMDDGLGECLLRRPELRAEVVAALRHWHGVRLDLDQSVVMPNHVHALITPSSASAPGPSINIWEDKALFGRRRTLITSCAARPN